MKRESTHRLLRFRNPVGRRTYLAVLASSVAALGLAWSLLSYTEALPAAFFPSPAAVSGAAVEMFGSERLLTDLLVSACRIGLAFLAAALLAVPLGLLMSSFKVVEALAEPIVDFVRYVPVPALVPVFVLWSGIGEGSKFLVLFFGTFFQLALLVMDDADNVPQLNFDLARTLGASTPQVIRDVLIPALLPQIYDRLRITLGWCWTYLVIAELIAAERGIGRVLREAQRFGAAEKIVVCLVVLGLVGLLTDYVAKLAYRRLFPYAVKARLQAAR